MLGVGAGAPVPHPYSSHPLFEMQKRRGLPCPLPHRSGHRWAPRERAVGCNRRCVREGRWQIPLSRVSQGG